MFDYLRRGGTLLNKQEFAFLHGAAIVSVVNGHVPFSRDDLSYQLAVDGSHASLAEKVLVERECSEGSGVSNPLE